MDLGHSGDLVCCEIGAFKYGVIDFSGSGSVSGKFTAVNDLAAGWSIDYDGIPSSLDAVVLIKSLSVGTVVYVR